MKEPHVAISTRDCCEFNRLWTIVCLKEKLLYGEWNQMKVKCNQPSGSARLHKIDSSYI